MVLRYANKSKFTFQDILQVDLRWPLTLIWLLTTWTYKGFHIISINQVWFKSDFNFSNKAIFTISAYLTTWPKMTFDLGTWPFTAWTYEGSHIISINQVWFKLNFQLFKWDHFYIFSLSYNLTSDDLWPWCMTFDLINKWGFPCCIYDPSLVVIHQSMWKIEQMLTLFHNRKQTTTTVDKVIPMFFLLRQATQKWMG